MREVKRSNGKGITKKRRYRKEGMNKIGVEREEKTEKGEGSQMDS